MNIIILGAHGRTGHHMVDQAARADHSVTAVMRRVPEQAIASPHVTVEQADVLDPASLRGVLDGADVVVFAAGPSNSKEPDGIYSQGVANVVAEMGRAGVRRLVAISAVPVSAPKEKNLFERLILHPILWRFFGPSYADLRLMEESLRGTSDIDWTVVRPPLLTDDAPTGTYRSSTDSRLPGARKISRQDLATAMLDAALDDSLIGHVVTVSA
ncbi:MAG: NAD(P)H-binding protein [Arachnia sp.]